jgi:hypothetical protein
MRKVLIATIVAMVLFAVGAFAARFAVDGEDIASGADQVSACTEEVTVDFEHGTYDEAAFDWPVTSATITAPGCAADAEVTLEIHNGTNGEPVEATGTVGTGVSSINGVMVGDVTEVAVLIEGVFLDVVDPGTAP